MKNKVAIFGAGQRAREIKRLLAFENIITDCFVIDEEYFQQEFFDGTKVVTTKNFLAEYSPENTALYLGVGMPKMNRVRERVFEKFHSHGYTFETYISPRANVLTDDIGEGNTIFAGVNIGPGVKIGDANHFEMGAVISHDCTIGNFNFFALTGIGVPIISSGGSIFAVSLAFVFIIYTRDSRCKKEKAVREQAQL